MKRIVIIVWSAITISTMKPQEEAFTFKNLEINKKKFVVPDYDLFDCEKYMLPKLGNAPVHHTFFKPQDIEEAYKQMKIDKEELNHNLDKTSQQPQKPQKKMGEQDLQTQQGKKESEEEIPKDLGINRGRVRPPIRKTGYTHFIHIPMNEVLKKVYEDEIFPRIEEEDRDILLPLDYLHMTVMVFRLKNEEDLKEWAQIIKLAKKTNKVSIQGVDFFPVKKTYGRVLYLKIKGLEDLIDTIVRGAIQSQLITQQDLSHIKFDKIKGMYVSEPHISLLKTKGQDLLDFTYYKTALKHINLKKVSINQIRVSMISSFDGQDYYNEAIHKL